MKNKKILSILTFLLACNLSILTAEEKVNERYSGRIIDQTGSVPGFSATYVTVTIEKYNQPEEIVELAKLLAEKGNDAVLKAIEDREVGRIRIGNRLSYPLAMARTFETEGKRVIRAMTDRPIQMVEAWRDNRSMDYPFGFLEIILDAEGKGQGVLVVAAKIEFKDGKIEMETYGREPFRLTNMSSK